jgi:uncharacterized protein YndB with AHSA1/START domain
MELTNSTSITVETVISAPIKKVWKCWSEPADIMQWCNASDDCHAPYADNDLREGGSFKTTMAAKDGSFSFDFGGVYTSVQEHKMIGYTMEDGRKVKIAFEDNGNTTKVTETFDAEKENPIEMQKSGWQAILDNFKKHVEKGSS